MPEQLSPEQEQSKSAGQAESTPEAQTSEERQAELVKKATEAFEAKDFELLDRTILLLGLETGVDLETEHEEALKQNQKMVDLVFGEKRFDLKREYILGNIQMLTPEQEKAAKKEGYSEFLIIPGQVSRQESIQAVDSKYKELFNQDIWYSNEAKEDLNQTKAVQEPSKTRPQGFYTIAIRPQKETIEAHPETINKTLDQQLEYLKAEQTRNPQLNLKGMTITEAMLLDAYFCANSPDQKDHADNSHRKWSYNRCLEEVTPNGRALGLYWSADDSRVLAL